MSIPIYSLSDSDDDTPVKNDSDVEDYLLNSLSSPLTKKTKVDSNVLYPLSDSDTPIKNDSDVEDYLLGSFCSPLTKKTKVDSNVSRSPAKKSRLPSKAKDSGKSDEEKKKRELKKQEAEEKRLRRKEEKEKAAEEKKRLRDEKKKEHDLNKQSKPKECMKFISVIIDSSLLHCEFGGEILTSLTKDEIKYIVRDQLVPGSISWQRHGENQDPNIPKHIVVIWLWKELINLLLQKNLDSTVDDILQQNPGHTLTIVIFGIEEYFRQRKISENRALKSNILGKQPTRTKKTDLAPEVFSNLSRTDIEIALTSLQLRSNQQYHFFETKDDIGSFVCQFTKAVAELPFKLKNKEKQDENEWYAEADSRECVPIDKSGNGLLRLWQQQLIQFPIIGRDIAQAVAAEYPSPALLMEAYDRCSTRKEGKALLKNIQVRRAQGPLPSTVRQVGPAFSKKAYHFFTSTAGSEMLSMED